MYSSIHNEFVISINRTQGGVHIHPDHVTITTPTRMWVKALELLLDRMKAAQFPFPRVRAVSGAGQVGCYCSFDVTVVLMLL